MALQCIYGCNDDVDEDGDRKEFSEIPGGGRREWRLPGLLYTEDPFPCGESEEDKRAIGGQFIEVCRRK